MPIVESKKLFDDLEESNNYLQESLGYPRNPDLEMCSNLIAENCNSKSFSCIFCKTATNCVQNYKVLTISRNIHAPEILNYASGKNPSPKRSQKAERTREWLLTHNIEETSEIITANTELENQVSTVKSERDELAILNENLNERCDMLITQNGKLKSQLHGEFNAPTAEPQLIK